MTRLGGFIARHKFLVILIGFLLLIPSAIGTIATRVNYDLLSYLQDNLETVDGQDRMVDEYGMGAFSMIVVENMELKDVQKLKEKIAKVDHVKEVLWYDDLADISVPITMIPRKYRKVFFNGDATMMIALFDDTTSSDITMETVVQLRKLVGKQCYISGMAGVVNDIKDVALKELPMYIVIASILSLLVLELTMDSFLVPVFFLMGIGMAVLYNLGSNIFLGQVSYITKSLTAVLQLGVTMDYSMFLLHSYEEAKLETEDREEAMGKAISETFIAIVGSSITTVAGFTALCFMTFALGKDLGIVMAKGVLIGVVTCVTTLPSMILFFDKWIEKTKHRPIIHGGEKLSRFLVRYHVLAVIGFLALLYPAIHGNNNVSVYYDISRSLPQTLPSNVANKKLEDEFDMATVHLLMLDRKTDSVTKRKMIDEIRDVKGVKWCIGMDSIFGARVPESMIPKKLRNKLMSDKSELVFVGSEYSQATKPVNRQLAKINKITKHYDPGSIIVGEAPLMKDLEDVTNVDIRNVNIASVLCIFVIIMIVFRSVSIPLILVSVIEFAILLNMSVAYYTGVELPFVASIVVGTIQLGACVDYAIVLTTRYVNERKDGKGKMEAISISHQANMISIFTSAMSLFAATFGVTMYSSVDMIGAICTLLARGAVMSMFIVITLLPALLIIFDKIICKTTMGMTHIDY